jgi:hypothetical protein
MLTNHQMDSGAPFAALLVGQPALRHRLRLGVLAALDQRILVRYALAGMTATETAGYITHHVKIAGRTDTLFSADAVTLIHNASRGYPRAINNLAVNALTSAFARNSSIVDEKAARIAISETAPTDRHHHRAEHPGTKHDQGPSATSGRGPFPHHLHRQHERRHRLQDQRRTTRPTERRAYWSLVSPLRRRHCPRVLLGRLIVMSV